MAPWSMPPSYWKNCFPAMNRCSRDAYVLSTGPGVPPMEKNETNTNSHAYEAERRVRHVDYPGLRITELQVAPGQSTPWHHHTEVQDTIYVVRGRVEISLADPEIGRASCRERVCQYV